MLKFLCDGRQTEKADEQDFISSNEQNPKKLQIRLRSKFQQYIEDINSIQ